MFLGGGVRRGTDVFKAFALGASGIFVSSRSLLARQAICVRVIQETHYSFFLDFFRIRKGNRSRVRLCSRWRRGWSEERASDDERRVGTHNDIKWMNFFKGEITRNYIVIQTR